MTLAAEHPPAALVLRSPFMSMVDVGRMHYPIFPVRWLLRDRYASSERIARIRCPLLVIAGDADGIIPLEQSRRLYDVAPSPKQLVVISGAEQTIQQLWKLSAGMHGIAMGAALYGTVVGSIVGSWPADRFGRRLTLLGIGVLFLASAIGCALAQNAALFIASRFVGGLGIGISTVAAPLYISEIAPPARRGRLAAMFQFNIVLGIVIVGLAVVVGIPALRIKGLFLAVTTFASTIVLNPRRYPRPMAARTDLPARTSSLIRSKMTMFASAATPIVRMRPAKPGSVSVTLKRSIAP